MTEERGFDVVDRRRVGSAEREASPDEGREAPPSEPSPAGETGAEYPLGEISVAGILRLTVGMLNEHAWVSMGLMPNPVTGQVERNLAEARQAIDVLADLQKHLEAQASEPERRELQVLLSNLRLNFVRQSAQSGE